jgi:hypothetical protein
MSIGQTLGGASGIRDCFELAATVLLLHIPTEVTVLLLQIVAAVAVLLLPLPNSEKMTSDTLFILSLS